MSDEIKITNNNEEPKKLEECSKCFCQSKGFKKFIVTALGTFVGVYCALSLFAALHRPPMMPPMGFHKFPCAEIEKPCPCPMMHNHFKHHNGNKVQHKEGRPAPFEHQKSEVDD